jgi:hypothetical protein
MILARNKLPSLIKYLKDNKIRFKKDEKEPDIIFNIYFDKRWVPLRKDSETRGVLTIEEPLRPLVLNFMRRVPAKSETSTLPGCTYDTTQMKGKTFMRCPECNLLVIPGVPHPTTKTLSNGKIVYV